MEETNATSEAERAFQNKLKDEKTLEALTRLLDRVETLETTLNRMDVAMQQLPGFVAMATDTADEMTSRAVASGIDIDERVGVVLQLMEKLTEKETAEALSRILDQKEALKQSAMMLEEAPNFAAMSMDVVDDTFRRIAAMGIDVEDVIYKMGIGWKHAVQAMTSEAFEELLNSGVLTGGAMRWMTIVGASLNRAEEKPKQQVGLFGAMKAMGDPDVQRAMGFLFSFLKELGTSLKETKKIQS